MTRLVAFLGLGIAALAFSPTTASAQFRPSTGYPGNNYPGLPPGFQPFSSFNPFYAPPRWSYTNSTSLNSPFVPQYGSRSRMSVSVSTPSGTTTFISARSSYGTYNPTWFYAPLYLAYGSNASQSGYYSNNSTGTYGGASVRPNLVYEAQNDLLRAQRAMSAPGVYGSSGSLSVAKPGALGAVIDSGPTLTEGFAKALAPADQAKVVSGEALNDLLREIVKAEPKGGNRVSAFVPVALLDEMRFGGTDAGDALNLARAGNLNFPVAFDDAALKDLRVALARDFNAVAVPLRSGKSPDPAKRAQLEATLQKVDVAIAPIIKNLSFADSTDTRRFLNQLSNAVKAMKAGVGNGLIDPKWEVEGTTTADLVKHMTRYKLRFAAAPDGNEESYTTLYRNLSTYLFLLTQPKK